MESQIFEICKKIFNDMSSLLSNYYGDSINVFADLNGKLGSIPNGLEWKKFIDANKEKLISSKAEDGMLESNLDSLSLKTPNAAELVIPTYKPGRNSLKRDVKDITFANDSHQATLPILEGVLSKKEGTLSKKYVSYYYVITRAKYLLEFQSRSAESYQPTLVLYLPECMLKPPGKKDDANTFIIYGKDATGVLKTRKNNIFKTQSSDEYMVC
ncbi:unnamed protein product [Ambrosiozyma monospora]|uniref:Unnamed protein product n=1 Tax=Ambrosiozyma monospora TaxID=43982 RepID=A0ACB5U7K6_AMBMO|nr:unnamed protein product [Ambrosiozyma monospora]